MTVNVIIVYTAGTCALGLQEVHQILKGGAPCVLSAIHVRYRPDLSLGFIDLRWVGEGILPRQCIRGTLEKG